MLRFIVKRVSRDQGHVSTSLLTVDADVAELEKQLKIGGSGGGPDGDDFLYCELVGVELLKVYSAVEKQLAALSSPRLAIEEGK